MPELGPLTTLRGSAMLTLLDPTWECPGCHGTGLEPDRETGQERRCRVCQGARVIDWDPDDTTEIPF